MTPCWGGDGNDYLVGNAGNDLLNGGSGKNKLSGWPPARTNSFRSRSSLNPPANVCYAPIRPPGETMRLKANPYAIFEDR